MVKCDECEAEMQVPQDAIVGEIVKCKECGSEFEVAELGKDGPRLKVAEVAEEDWGE